MRPLALVMASVLLVGCASGSGSDSGPNRSRDVITEAELAEQPSGTAHDAVSRLRPGWLRSRGRTIGQESLPRVFVDGRDFGPLATLSQFRIENISEIRFISARDATTRYGTGYPGGIISITTKGPDAPVP